MNKEKRLIKRLAIGAAIIGVAVAGVGTLAYSLSSHSQKLTREERGAKSKNDNMAGKKTRLISQQDKAANSLELYQKLTGGGEEILLDKKALTRLLYKLNKNYDLIDLVLNVDPMEERSGTGFDKKTGNIITAHVDISFKSITDSHALAFSQKMFQELAGFINVRDFELIQIGKIDKATLYSTLENGSPHLVEGKLTFDWIGLKTDVQPAAQ